MSDVSIITPMWGQARRDSLRQLRYGALLRVRGTKDVLRLQRGPECPQARQGICQVDGALARIGRGEDAWHGSK